MRVIRGLLRWLFRYLSFRRGQGDDSNMVTHKVMFDGREYTIVDGFLYREGVLQPLSPIYDPDFYKSPNYISQNGEKYRVSDGQQYLIENNWQNGFELATLQENGWNGQILQGQNAFVEITEKISYSNKNSVHCHTEKPVTPPAKAAIRRELFFFEQGDTLEVEAWYYVANGKPSTILDIEDESHREGTGMRVLVDKDYKFYLELKWPNKIKWVSRELMPVDKWFKIKVAYFLHVVHGTVKLWVDDNLIIDGEGQTIALPDTIYSRVETGITATDVETDLAVDGVSVRKIK